MVIKSPYDLDRFIGMEYFITNTSGIGGKLRTFYEDFYVEEIISPKCKEGDYLYFILEKKNLDTLEAITKIAKKLRISKKRFSFAGNKDKRAWTKQIISVYKLKEEEIKKVNIPSIKIHVIGKGDKIKLGDAKGNFFRIIIREIENVEEIEKTKIQLREYGIPNYFGYQRFGTTRPNTHLVGREIVNNNLKNAVLYYLGKPFETEGEKAYYARKILENTMDYKLALNYFPKNLRYERAMLSHLVKHPRDYAGALRRIPLKLRKLLVHAYQSYLFNKVLSRMIGEEESIKNKKLQIIGYKSKLNEIEKEVLEEEGISKENFKIKSMPELSSPGTLRNACIEANIEYEIKDDSCIFEFSLPKGSYATVILREFMKSDPLNY